MTIAESLVEHLVETHQSSPATIDRLTDLTAHMDMFFASGRARKLTEDETTAEVWKTYFSRDGVPAANVRIATLDLESIFTDEIVYLKQSGDDPRAQDGSSGKAKSARPPVSAFEAQIKRAMVRYLRQLLGTELQDVVEVARAAAASSRAGNRKVVISLDYYSDRSTDSNILHKDTAGITLFVALHYVNPLDMLGPEYIHDKWPLASVGTSPKHNFTPAEPKGTSKRFHTPWTQWRGSYYWPRALLKELEAARDELPDDKTLHHVELHPYGLVSFVDELVYHATPFNKSRTQEDLTRLFQDVTFSGNKYSILPPTLKRTLSKALEVAPQSVPGMTGGASKRCFIRLWISICRKSWYEPLMRFSL